MVDFYSNRKPLRQIKLLLWIQKDFNSLGIVIFFSFRYRGNYYDESDPTPEEFIQYILDSAEEKGPHVLDNHIKPLWASCPFCAVDFDVVGHLEDFDKDSNFIYTTLDLIVREPFYSIKVYKSINRWRSWT